MHYPSDILVGLLFGAATASLAYLIYFLAFRTMKTKTSFVSSQFTKTGYSLNDIDVVAWVLAASYCLAIIIALIHQS
jgi:undecaprenyl-diphosphatase